MIEEWDDISDYKEMDLVKFIRHYWLSKIDNNITKLKIYEKVKERILNKQESITNFIRGLLDEAEVYVNLINPRDEFWIDDPTSKIVLENLSAL